MKKIISKKEYDTEPATEIKAYYNGVFGEPSGYAEVLCQTPEGLYFLHVHGGETSPYPTDDIIRIAKTKVNAWIDEH